MLWLSVATEILSNVGLPNQIVEGRVDTIKKLLYHLNRHSSDMTRQISKARKARKELASEQAIMACAERFGLVGDPTRMKICWLLCNHKELSVSEIAEALNVSVSVVSHSLKRLKDHELVESRREHKQVFYGLKQSDFGTVLRASLADI